MNKNSAPKGKRKVKPKTIRANTKTKTGSKSKQFITVEKALTFLQTQGIKLTEENIEGLTAIAGIHSEYKGDKADGSRQLKILMLQALESTLGVVSTASLICGIHRSTHYDWMQSDEEYSNLVKELSEVALDYSEAALFEMVKQKVPAAVFFHLKTKGKKRGYIETVHNMNQNFEDNNVHFFLPDNGRDISEAQIVNE